MRTVRNIRRFEHLQEVLNTYGRGDPETIKALIRLWLPGPRNVGFNIPQNKAWVEYSRPGATRVWLKQYEKENFFHWIRMELGKILENPIFPVVNVIGRDRLAQRLGEFTGALDVVVNDLGGCGVRGRDAGGERGRVEWLTLDRLRDFAAWLRARGEWPEDTRKPNNQKGE